MELMPYLFLDGRCEEAIAFYQQSLGANQMMLMRFKQAPDPALVPPGGEDKVMHARLQIGSTTVLMSDGRCGGKPNLQGFALSLTTRDVSEAERLFSALSDGGTVQMPMTATFFSPAFGMVADRFGVSWMVHVEK